MQAFLEQVAEYLHNHYDKDLKNQCVIFANRRAALFFNKYLKQLYKEPLWSPRVLTISELFEYYTEGQKTEKLNLIFELYQAYCYVLKEQEPFDKFYFWGNMMLRDFDEIDKYLIEPKLIFSNVTAHKELEQQFDYIDEEQKEFLYSFWKVFEESKISNETKGFATIWAQLYDIYKEFNLRLDDKKYYYEGKLYKKLVDKLKDEGLDIEFDQIHVVGFNALNRCEISLFNHFKKTSKVNFYWDADHYYVQRKFHEAGHFMRRNIQMFPPPKDFRINNNIEESIESKQLNLKIYSIGLEIGQAAKTGEILQKAKYNIKDDQTAVILPDEHLLMPVLQSVPSSIDKINISMGYSFKETPLFALFENIIALQNSNKSTYQDKFYFKNALAILNHPYLFEEDNGDYMNAINRIVKSKQLWIKGDSLPKTLLVRQIFCNHNHYKEFNTYLLQILFSLYNKFKSIPASYLEVEFIYHTYLQVQKFSQNINDLDIEMDMVTYLKLFRQILNDISVPFIGEPLDGLQIMGVLETRSLDFKNLFILSMNEGKMPAKSVDNSFIPYALRKGYGLPTIEEFDAVYAYYFYRLIQRSENVHLFYNNIQEGNEKAEKSRFLHQLEYELNKNNVLKEFVQKNDFKQSSEHPISIEGISVKDQTQKFRTNNQGKVGKYLTPSAINKYLDCSLAFYFRYVMNLFAKDELTEEVDNAMFGTILHEAMEHLYLNQINKHGRLIKEAHFEDLENAIDDVLLKVIFEQLGLAQNELDGDPYIINNIIKTYIQKIFELDKSYAPFTILGLETDKEEGYKHISPKGYGVEGKIDRIDEKDGVVRIIDYKTGAVDWNVKSLSGLFNNEKHFNKYALQAFLYSCLFEVQNRGKYKAVVPYIIGVKDLYKNEFNGLFKYEGDDDVIPKGHIADFTPYVDSFIELMDGKLIELEDKNLVFKQVDDQKYCKYCDYKNICIRS